MRSIDCLGIYFTALMALIVCRLRRDGIKAFVSLRRKNLSRLFFKPLFVPLDQLGEELQRSLLFFCAAPVF